ALVSTFRIRAPPRRATRMVTPGAVGRWKEGACSRRLQVPRRSVRLAGELLHELILALFHFLRRELFLARGDRADVALRISERSRAVAPELVLHLAHRSIDRASARRHRAVVQRIAIFDVDPERRGRPAE